MQPIKPNYAPNTVNQTVEYGGVTWKGQPGGDWVQQSGGGTSGANLASYDSLINGLPKATDLTKTIDTNENNAFNDYLSYLKSQPGSAQNYKSNLEAAGIPNLQKAQTSLTGQMYSLEDAIRNVEPQVAATTQNSLVTEGQRQGIVQEKLNPLQKNYGTISTALGRVSQAVSQGKADALTLTGLQQSDTQTFANAYKEKLALVSNQGSRALQAFIADNDRLLEVTLAKIHRGEQISDQEAQNAFQLMTLQKQAEIRMKELEFQASQGGDNGLMTLSEGQTLYDPVTGQVKYTAPKTYKAGGGGNPVDTSSLYSTNATSNNPFGIDPAIYNYIMGQ